MRREVNRFSDELKLKVVTEYLSTDISQAEFKFKYGFRGNSNICRGIRKFGVSKPDDKFFIEQKIMSKEVRKSKEELDLEAKFDKLESELAYEKLRAEALSTMIGIAEDRFKIPIRKESDTINLFLGKSYFRNIFFGSNGQKIFQDNFCVKILRVFNEVRNKIK